MGRRKELAKNTAILTLGKLLTKVVSFLFLPLYTAILLAEEMGTYDLMVTYGTLLFPLVNWQFGQGLFRFMLDNREDTERHTVLFSTLLTSSVFQCAAYAVIFLLIRPLLRFEDTYFLLWYVILSVFMTLLMQFVRGLGSNTKYAVASFISAAATTILNVVAIVWLHMGIKGMFISTLIAQAMTVVYLIFASKCWRYFRFGLFDRAAFKSVCAYSLPLIPNNLAWWVVNASDRTVISVFLGVAANGIYAVANKFPNLFIQFYNILNLSWTETVTLHYQDEDRDEFLTETMTDLFKLFSCVCFLLIAVMPFLFPVMVNAKYADAYNHILILLYGMLFRVLVGLYSCIYIAQKNAKKIAATSVSAAIINLTVDFLLIRRIRIYAASVSTLVAFLTMFVFRYLDVNKTVRMRIRPKIAVSSIIAGAVCTVSYYSGNRILQAAVFAAVLVYSAAVNMDMVRAGSGMVRRMFRKKSGKGEV